MQFSKEEGAFVLHVHRSTGDYYARLIAIRD
jgi:hypothetical protein